MNNTELEIDGHAARQVSPRNSAFRLLLPRGRKQPDDPFVTVHQFRTTFEMDREGCGPTMVTPWPFRSTASHRT